MTETLAETEGLTPLEMLTAIQETLQELEWQADDVSVACRICGADKDAGNPHLKSCRLSTALAHTERLKALAWVQVAQTQADEQPWQEPGE